MVFFMALRITGEYGVAEEVAEDAFLGLHRWGDRLDSEDHARFWLRRVTVHRATSNEQRATDAPALASRGGDAEGDDGGGLTLSLGRELTMKLDVAPI